MSRPGVSLTSPARDVTRCQIAFMKHANAADALSYAEARWGRAWVERAAVAGTEYDSLAPSPSARSAFMDLVRERSVLGRLPGLRSVSRNVRHFRPANFGVAAWVGEGLAIPATKFDMTGFSLGSKKVAALAVFSNEALDDPRSENAIETDLVRACEAALATALLDPSGSGSAATPASIVHAAPTISSSGDPAVDVAELVANYQGDLATATFICDPITASRMAMYRDSSGMVAFPDVGINGGEILRAPLIVTRYSPHDSSGGSLILCDGASIAATFDEVVLSRSGEAMLEQDTGPAGDTLTPTTASANLVSLFQSEATAVKCVIYADWTVARAGGVAVVVNANY